MKTLRKYPFLLYIIFIITMIGIMVGIKAVYDKITEYDINQDVEVLSDNEKFKLIENWYRENAYIITVDSFNEDMVQENCPYDVSKPIYSLETTMGEHKRTDYGSKEEIHKLKCKRLAEFEKSISKYKQLKIDTERAEKKRDSIEDADLKELNQPCK